MNAILQLVVETFVHPRQIAESIVQQRFGRDVIWTGALLAMVLVGVVQFAVLHLTPQPAATPETEAFVGLFNAMFSTPFMTILIVGSGLIMSVVAVCFGGRMIGGTGDFQDSLALMAWLQFVNALTGSIIVVMLVISPQFISVASILNLVFNAGIFYATLHFIDVLHGFKSLWAAFGTIVISFIGLAVGLALILVFIGGAAVQTGAV